MRAWELEVREWDCAPGTVLADAVKYTVMIKMTPIFLRSNLQLGTYSNSAALRKAFVAMVFFPKRWSIPDRVSWKWKRCG